MKNILTDAEQHARYCVRPLTDSVGVNHCGGPSEWGYEGDVRRCKHGHLMMAYDVMGATAPNWRTLHPIWTPVRYWRARKALRDG